MRRPSISPEGLEGASTREQDRVVSRVGLSCAFQAPCAITSSKKEGDSSLSRYQSSIIKKKLNLVYEVYKLVWRGNNEISDGALGTCIKAFPFAPRATIFKGPLQDFKMFLL